MDLGESKSHDLLKTLSFYMIEIGRYGKYTTSTENNNFRNEIKEVIKNKYTLVERYNVTRMHRRIRSKTTLSIWI